MPRNFECRWRRIRLRDRTEPYAVQFVRIRIDSYVEVPATGHRGDQRDAESWPECGTGRLMDGGWLRGRRRSRRVNWRGYNIQGIETNLFVHFSHQWHHHLVALLLSKSIFQVASLSTFSGIGVATE